MPRRTFALTSALTCLAFAGCGGGSDEDVPLADGATVIDEWETPDEVGGTLTYQLVEGPDGVDATELTRLEVTTLESDGWKQKPYPGDPPSIEQLQSEDEEYRVRFGPAAEMARVAGSRKQIEGSSAHPDRTVVLQLVEDNYG